MSIGLGDILKFEETNTIESKRTRCSRKHGKPQFLLIPCFRHIELLFISATSLCSFPSELPPV